MVSDKDLERLFQIKPAAQPGAHASLDNPNNEYDNETVCNRLKFLLDSHGWSSAQHKYYQLEQLRKILTHARKNVPYYRVLFHQIGFHPNDIQKLSDIRHLPLLTKDIIRDNPTSFVSDTIDPKEAVYMTTGGSTGNPLKIIMDRFVRSKTHANTHYYMQIAGFKVGELPHIRLHGNRVPSNIVNRGEYSLIEGNRLTMSVYHINETTCAAYMKSIRDFKPAYIHAYASALVLLCSFAKKQNEIFPDSLQCVFCDSETLYDWQRKLIEQTTNVQINNIYGHTEGATMAISIPGSKQLYVIPQIGLTEILDTNGLTVSDVGKEGEIVVTGFNNPLFPFIRYRTNDFAVVGKPESRGPDFPLVLQSVKGRIQDYIVSVKKTLVPAAPLLFDYNFDWSGIKRFQLQQDKPGYLKILIVTEQNLEAAIFNRFSEMLGPDFSLKVETVDAIPCTNRGKYRYIEQKVDINEYR